MYIVVTGCVHGHLDQLYESIEELCKHKKIQVDLVLVTGDLETFRNEYDLECLACPPKYKELGDFYKYYAASGGGQGGNEYKTGGRTEPYKAKWLTVFVGGNHEASSLLQEVHLGGFVAENIYYMGHTGVILVDEWLRVAGISGIYKSFDYRKQLQHGLKMRYELLPFTENSLRSVYHYRKHEIEELSQMTSPIDIVMSHDWPNKITDCGDKQSLLRTKPFFRKDIETGELGSPVLQDLVHTLKPRYWFASHMHVKFAAIVPHHQQEDVRTQRKETRFLSLDKVIPSRDFLQLIEVFPENVSPPSTQEKQQQPDSDDFVVNPRIPEIKLDPEFLSILQCSRSRNPEDTIDRDVVIQKCGGCDRLVLDPTKFSRDAPAADVSQQCKVSMPQAFYRHEHTMWLESSLELPSIYDKYQRASASHQ